ncbi:MAG: SxtJ family membrane protein [Longimicrobiales bacterium]
MPLIEPNWNPDARELRTFGWVWLAGFGAFGALAAWRTGAFAGDGTWTPTLVLWTIAIVVATIALIRPTAARPIYRAWMALTLPIGYAVSYIVLGAIFYLVFTPTALLMRLIGRDALKRTIERDAVSYWEDRTADARPDIERYFRQY